jgi:heterodisulfide reductase subunit C
MLALRNLATKEGYAPVPLRNVLKALFETGHEFPFTGYTRKLRRQLGLSEIPPLAVSSPKALEEVQKLMKMSGVSHRLESGEMKK